MRGGRGRSDGLVRATRDRASDEDGVRGGPAGAGNGAAAPRSVRARLERRYRV